MKIDPYQEVRKYLEESENPLFFFDDDPDGLCSYLLLKKCIERGYGIVVKSAPELPSTYLKAVKRNNPDRIFILDKPLVNEDFISQAPVPIIWIDHHGNINPNGVKYYNPKNFNQSFPTSYFCYKVTEENQWLATIGCISDWYKPDFLKEFSTNYPDILPNPDLSIEEISFDTPLTKISKIFRFILKGKAEDVERSVRYIERISDPHELLGNKTKESKFILKHYEKINKQYETILEGALKTKSDGNFFIYIYSSSETSLTSYLSNELIHRLKGKVIIIGREKDDRLNLSIRCPFTNILEPLTKSIKDLDATGGGHDHACGANVSKKDFNQFISNLKKNIKN